MPLQYTLLTRTPGENFRAEDLLVSGGKRYFVHNSLGSDTTNNGQDRASPYATLAYALTKVEANKGDKIFLLPGHTETLTAVVTVSTAGVSIIGLGEGIDRPEITVNGTVDGISFTATDCLIENVYFNEATAAATANINIAAARTIVRGCHFDLGTNDLDNITVTADGDDSIIAFCRFRVTANGPDSAITVEGAADNLNVVGNYFDGGSTTNTWDDAAIDLGAQVPVNVVIQGNTFVYGVAVVSTGAAPRAQGDNSYLRGARAAAGVPVDIYASAGVSGTKSGSKEDPTTIVDAINLATGGDRVLLYPGTYTVTAALAMDVANLTVQPVNYIPGQRTCQVEIANDTDDVNTADITADGITLQGLFFTKGVANTSDGTELLDVGANRFTCRDCIFDMETRTNADVINIATSTKHHLIENCLFTDLADGKSDIVWACSTLEVRNCIFDHSAADAIAFEQIASPGDGSSFHTNLIISDGATDPWATWQSSPGKNVMTKNYVFGSGADADGGGDDGDLDAWAYGNYRDGATDGTLTTLNPSVS
jgi:hypothetical protein